MQKRKPEAWLSFQLQPRLKYRRPVLQPRVRFLALNEITLVAYMEIEMDSLPEAAGNTVGVCGSGTGSHGAGRVMVLSCQWLESTAQRGMPSEPFDQCIELGNPETHSRQGLDL